MTPTHYLRPLLAPDSVVLIGANAAGTLGRVVCNNLQSGGYHGELFAVDPSGPKRFGRKSLRSLRALPQAVDLAVICAAPAQVPDIIADCGGRARVTIGRRP